LATSFGKFLGNLTHFLPILGQGDIVTGGATTESALSAASDIHRQVPTNMADICRDALLWLA